MIKYLEEIYVAMQKRHNRKDLRLIYLHHTGKEVPKGVNLRKHVSLHHVIQQGINAGQPASKFYLKNVGLMSRTIKKPRTKKKVIVKNKKRIKKILDIDELSVFGDGC